jgi:hypothetical protein
MSHLNLKRESGDLWDQFFSGQLSVKGSQVTETSLQRLALAISHLKAGRALPRRIPPEYRNNNNSIFDGMDIWLLFQCNIEDKPKIFNDLMDAKSPSVVFFLENWIQTSNCDNDSIRAITDAVEGLWRCNRVPAISKLDDVGFGNLVATVILSYNSHPTLLAEHCYIILSSLFRCRDRDVGFNIFKRTILRLEKSDMIVALIMFSKYFSEVYYLHDYNQISTQLIDVLADELWRIRKPESSFYHSPPISCGCLHIVLYMADNKEWFLENQSLYMLVVEPLHRRIGKFGVQWIWDRIGFSETYLRLEEEPSLAKANWIPPSNSPSGGSYVVRSRIPQDCQQENPSYLQKLPAAEQSRWSHKGGFFYRLFREPRKFSDEMASRLLR